MPCPEPRSQTCFVNSVPLVLFSGFGSLRFTGSFFFGPVGTSAFWQWDRFVVPGILWLGVPCFSCFLQTKEGVDPGLVRMGVASGIAWNVLTGYGGFPNVNVRVRVIESLCGGDMDRLSRFTLAIDTARGGASNVIRQG